mmetsp:Transcript_81117/g.262794  ORF Transcript_81117/g.262794 Transcript_81117/m.262794 type:complete len:277 (+) Transcript_81117:330-1160(+)
MAGCQLRPRHVQLQRLTMPLRALQALLQELALPLEFRQLVLPGLVVLVLLCGSLRRTGIGLGHGSCGQIGHGLLDFGEARSEPLRLPLDGRQVPPLGLQQLDAAFEPIGAGLLHVALQQADLKLQVLSLDLQSLQLPLQRLRMHCQLPQCLFRIVGVNLAGVRPRHRRCVGRRLAGGEQVIDAVRQRGAQLRSWQRGEHELSVAAFRRLHEYGVSAARIASLAATVPRWKQRRPRRQGRRGRCAGPPGQELALGGGAGDGGLVLGSLEEALGKPPV